MKSKKDYSILRQPICDMFDKKKETFKSLR